MPAVDVGSGAAARGRVARGTDGALAGRAGDGAAAGTRWRWAAAVAALFAFALALRLWGVAHGMPYAYNADENAHFVPGALALFGHSWNPHYFINPPAYTYLLHGVFAVWFGGRDGVAHAYATDPTQVFVVARATSAIAGAAAVPLLYLAGARLAGRPVGLLAAALLTVAFLPVFYGHLALNDGPTLAPIALSLWGTAGVLCRGRTIDFALAGVGTGLACATKYTGGIAVLPLVAAAVLGPARDAGARVLAQRLLVAAAGAIAAFAIVDPYAILDVGAFRDGVAHQADAAAGKLGLTEDSGIAYYAWTFTWGLGWVPILAAVAGAVLLAVRDRRLLAVLAPAPVAYLLFMGAHERFFGRWLMPIFPLCCLLAAIAAWSVAGWVATRRPALRRAAAAAAGLALCGQGLVFSAHVARVLSRDDTRNLTRAWMVAHVPPRTRIVVEPGVFPDAWANDVGGPAGAGAGTANGRRWTKFPSSRSRIANDGSLLAPPGRVVNVEDYERTLVPGLVDRYEREGYCYVVSGSTQRGRAEAQPGVVPGAVAYYRELERRSDVVFSASPYRRGARPVPFSFDWSFDYYPLAYERPGALVRVYRLRGGACARVS